MTLKLDHELHFRCSFELVPRHGADIESLWGGIVRVIRDWIGKKTDEEAAFYKSAGFYNGFDYKPKNPPRTLISTARFIGAGTDKAPEAWTVRFTHSDRDQVFRQWQTDIGITKLRDRFGITVSTVFWTLPAYVGKEPEAPTPSVPGVVGKLIKELPCDAFSGDQALGILPTVVNEDWVENFVARIASPRRRCPLVYVSRTNSSDKLLIDTKQIARHLIGTAAVYEAASSRLDRAMEHLLPLEFRCRNGAVRVYQPAVQMKFSGDSRRHRFFTAKQVEEDGAGAIQEYIIRGIVRRARLVLKDRVLDIDDISTRRRESRLDELKTLRESGKNSKELLELYEEEVRSLLAKIDDKQKDVDFLTGEMENFEELKNENKRIQYEKDALVSACNEAERRAGLAETKACIIENLSSFPETLVDVVELCKTTFANRLVFTPKAIVAAGKARLRNSNVGWKCLRAMATDLHSLHFGSESLAYREICTRFRNSTGLEIGLESETTGADKKLRAQREDIYKGKKVYMSPHLKHGRDPGSSLRIHYHVDQEDRLLVIGHCGDHLDTVGTN